MTKTGKSILVVRLDAIGDWILFRNALHALRASDRFAAARLTVLGNPAWRPLAEAFDRDAADEWIWAENRADLFRKPIENLLPGALWHRRVRRAQAPLRAALRARGFDAVLSLRAVPDPQLDVLVSGLAPETVGVRAPGRDPALFTRLLDPGSEPFVFLQNRALVSALAGRPCDAPLALPAVADRDRSDAVLVFLGASHWTKRWPRRRVRELVRLLLAETPWRVMLADAPRPPLRFAASFSSPRVSAAPPLPLPAFAALVASVGAVVSNDTMALHLAAAVGTPVVAVANGLAGRGDFWPYPDSLGKQVTVLAAPPAPIPAGILAAQLAAAHNLRAVSARQVLRPLILRPLKGSQQDTPLC